MVMMHIMKATPQHHLSIYPSSSSFFPLKRYDLAAKCYRQALHCVKETPALGEREKASKTQEIQVAQMLIILVLMLMLMLRPPQVTEMLIVLEWSWGYKSFSHFHSKKRVQHDKK